MFLLIERIAFSIGPLDVYWYGIILGTAALVGLILAVTEGKKRGVHPDVFLDLVLWAVPISIIFARAYYVIFSWDYYSVNPGDIIKIWEGGIAIHGALIGAILTAVIFSKKRGVSFWKLADIAAPSLILGQAIGRWGNFINQEAHGREVSREFLEGLGLPNFIIEQMNMNGVYYHPTFLYESLWNLLGFILLILLRRVNLRRGELFLTYFIWYSIGRFFIEGMRTDSLMLMDTIRVAQLVSILSILLGIGFIWYRRKKGNSNIRYLDPELVISRGGKLSAKRKRSNQKKRK
ncbi:prolipoprotein diacylglyceryl transferase [Microaerobacter geothermalis]|uniref:prolipoprotein diacylglyceryl transferase n=1 Tax=Microaerobacter geothermalis TaxID=674972 RepID=UPI001F203AF5|nr:prolipoprotein diacylglyceryl transferase [Microaerobacter geothermalis]MCF6094562.1 prolipoprotein diacylglyceryl transferase [Microaerobacter geothermalis]